MNRLEEERQLMQELSAEIVDPVYSVLVRDPNWSRINQILQLNSNTVYWKAGDGRNLLHFALQSAPVEVIRQILALAPELVNVGDPFQSLPVHIALQVDRGSSFEMVDLLTQGSAGRSTLLVKDWAERLPLHLACRVTSSIEIFRCLVERGGPEILREADGAGCLPLHLACLSGNCTFEVVKFLTKHYPEATRVRDMEGRLPIDLADRVEVIQWLNELQRLQDVHDLVQTLGVEDPTKLEAVVNRFKSKKRPS